MESNEVEGRTLKWGKRLLIMVSVATTWNVGSVNAAPPPVTSESSQPFDPDWIEVKILFNAKCLGCHRKNTKRYDFSSYEAILKAGHGDEFPAINPGRPEESSIWGYVSWNANADVNSELPNSPMMPEEKAEWLTPRQMNLIFRWIKNGALQYKLPNTCNISPLTELDFPSAKQCRACHPRQYTEWSRSMHAYAQHSPVFEAFNLTLVERTAGTIGTFCTRCHTPIGTALGENESVRNADRSRISREGVTCIVCHRRVKSSYKSSGRIYMQPGEAGVTCMYGPFDSDASELAASHKATNLPFMKSSQFCGVCHDVTNPVGVRLEEAFSEWHNSPAARDGVTCQHCHMGTEPGRPILDHQRPLAYAATVPGVPQHLLPLRRVSTHTFVGPDYAMLPDTEFPEKLDWMYEFDYRNPANMTPHRLKTLEALRRHNRRMNDLARADRYRLLKNAATMHVEHPRQVGCNSKLDLRVDVQSLTAGHSFPTGFTAERQVWISVEILDPAGEVLFASGYLDSNHDLCDNHSHDVLSGRLKPDRHLFNFQNKFVALGNKGTEKSVVLSVNRALRPVSVLRPGDSIFQAQGHPTGFRIAKYSMPPLRVIGKNYAIPMPGQVGPYQIRVRLNFRHLPPALLDRVGTPHLKHLLEIVVIDEYVSSVWVGPSVAQFSGPITR
jgi:nitrate/TMAO reductase-like tetraheme cytochrome c subunit